MTDLPTIHALAVPLYGDPWYNGVARDMGLASKTVARVASGRIETPGLLADIAAYLLARTPAPLPAPPAGADDDQRDAAADQMMRARLSQTVAGAQAVGWRPAELLAASLAATVDAMADGAGAPATIETLRDTIRQLADGLDR